MRMIDIIEKKRDGHILSQPEIQFWVNGLVNEEIPDYQSSALLMAIMFNGLNAQETTDLTMSMTHSGDVFDLSSINGIKVDKHSTGGVGDKTTLVLGPMVAACGAKIAKMSGRGLGFTGGTIDKLESIPGFNVSLDKQTFIDQVNRISLSIVGQTGHLVPADKKLYALRDVTGCVPSIPLIASSIMSKKLASGADTILLDVKYGEGAFMNTLEEAKVLAKAMIEIGKLSGKDTRAILSDMNQPLGFAIGNALEVKEAIATLQGQGPLDFTELCFSAGQIMLQQANIASTKEEALAMLHDCIDSKTAFEKFRQLVIAQGGDIDTIDHPEKLPMAQFQTSIQASTSGYVQSIQVMQLGIEAMKLGAGRKTKEDQINPAVGLVIEKKVGDYVCVGDSLLVVHHDQPLENEQIGQLLNCYNIAETKVKRPPLIAAVL